jgi:hypothetical protein
VCALTLLRAGWDCIAQFSPFSHPLAPSALLAAYVIGDICGVVANRDPATSEYEQSVVRVDAVQ